MDADPRSDEGRESRGEAALARALRSAPIAEEALARMRSAVASEWRTAHGARRPPHSVNRLRYSVAASIAVAVLSAWWLIDRDASGQILGVVRSEGAVGLVAHRRLFGDSTLAHGAELRTGPRITAIATTDVSLMDGGTLIIRQGSVFTASPPHVIVLESGSIYVDFDPAARHGDLVVRTPLGELRHVGTQFDVTVRAGEERIAVREGLVRVTGHTSTDISAGRAIVIDATGIRSTDTVQPYDREWGWVEAAMATPAIEGQTAAAFLHWLSRTTGKRLVWADDESRRLAERTTLHGSIESLAIDVAANAVLATTSLHARIDDKTIFVAADTAANPAH